MDNSQYNRETLASGYWVLHNYHYGHVAQARCNHEIVKSISLHKAPSDDKLKVSFDLAALPNEDELEIVIQFANGDQLVASDFIDYRCQRGLT
jgi:hypothetical protein